MSATRGESGPTQVEMGPRGGHPTSPSAGPAGASHPHPRHLGTLTSTSTALAPRPSHPRSDVLKIDDLSAKNRQIFLRTRFRRCAPALAASVQIRPLGARNREFFFGLPPALRACARRPRAGATDGWRGGPTPQSVRAECAKEGHFIQHLLTRRSWVRISFVGSPYPTSSYSIAFT